ncbi:hypothetical protein ACYULU_16215, partial [Breznakiellaceae bacterium SP9]
FWEGLSNEEVNMLTTEWDLDTALAVRWEEGWEDGIEKGREEGREEGIEEGIEIGTDRVLELVDKGYSSEQIKAMLSAGTMAMDVPAP